MWATASIAIIALLGVICPYLALPASLSDSNRAMNAVQEIPEKYVSRGLRITKLLGIFRRIRVPITHLAISTTIWTHCHWFHHRLRQASGPYTKETTCSGTPAGPNWPRSLRRIRHATWSANNSSTLVLLKVVLWRWSTAELRSSSARSGWILALDLLGRYGIRADKGIRRDFGGEKASICRRFRSCK